MEKIRPTDTDESLEQPLPTSPETMTDTDEETHLECSYHDPDTEMSGPPFTDPVPGMADVSVSPGRVSHQLTFTPRSRTEGRKRPNSEVDPLDYHLGSLRGDRYHRPTHRRYREG
jgi:hypothetical protein